MTVLTSTDATVLFTPSWYTTSPKPVFHLRAADVIERGQMEAELAGEHQAGKVYGFELNAAIRSGVHFLMQDDPGLDHVLSLISAESQGEADGLADEDKQILIAVRKALALHWPEYKDLVAQANRRREIVPIVCLRRFCTGWDDLKADNGKLIVFEQGRDGLVTEAALRRINPLDLMAVGNKAYALQYVDEDDSGNSPRPGSSDNGHATSSSDEPSKVAGTSANASGKKTRASRARPGRSKSSTSTK